MKYEHFTDLILSNILIFNDFMKRRCMHQTCACPSERLNTKIIPKNDLLFITISGLRNTEIKLYFYLGRTFHIVYHLFSMLALILKRHPKYSVIKLHYNIIKPISKPPGEIEYSICLIAPFLW